MTIDNQMELLAREEQARQTRIDRAKKLFGDVVNKHSALKWMDDKDDLLDYFNGAIFDQTLFTRDYVQFEEAPTVMDCYLMCLNRNILNRSGDLDINKYPLAVRRK